MRGKAMEWDMRAGLVLHATRLQGNASATNEVRTETTASPSMVVDAQIEETADAVPSSKAGFFRLPRELRDLVTISMASAKAC
jgi:hypothetical protein